MPSINGVAVTAWPQGRLDLANRETMTEPAFPGIDGSLVVLGAWKAAPVEVVTIHDFTLAADMNTQWYNFRLLENQLVPVIDALEYLWDNVLIVRFQGAPSVQIGPKPYRLTARWIMLPETVRPT